MLVPAASGPFPSPRPPDLNLSDLNLSDLNLSDLKLPDLKLPYLISTALDSGLCD